MDKFITSFASIFFSLLFAYLLFLAFVNINKHRDMNNKIDKLEKKTLSEYKIKKLINKHCVIKN